MISNIIYQKLEQKYSESAFDCIIQTKKQDGTLMFDLEVDPKILLQIQQNMFKDDLESSYKTTIIAIDTNKKNYVCGIFPGQDFCKYVENLKKQSSIEVINVSRRLCLRVVEPLIAKNYEYGEFLMGNGYGVRTEYENQKIGQNLTKYFLQNAKDLGYILTAGVFYNPKSAHIMLKANASIYSHIKINECSELDERYKKKLKNSDMYVIGTQIKNNIPTIKLPPILQIPQL